SDLGHYFRFVHNSMRAISESEFSTRTHRRLFRALFSDDELLIIFYNAVSKHGEGMVAFIEEFELFDNLPEGRLIQKEHKSILPAKCFGGSP
ncbi:MAG: putative phage abortive infection protein, partial [Pseudomonadota bacterium]